jgi:hypothetical protein
MDQSLTDTEVITFSIFPHLNPFKDSFEDDMENEDEQEWRVIPDFPKYEMNLDGQIRTIAQKAEMFPHYTGEEDVEQSVSLWREGGVIEKNLHNLIYEVFPEFKPVSAKARAELIKRFADTMSHWLGGEAFVYEDFEQLAEIVIEEGWRPE